MTDTLEKEDRYVVLKWSDMKAAGVDASDTLIQALTKVEDYREVTGKNPLEAVVIESDWPEYDLVWEMLEKRVSNIPPFNIQED